MLTLSSQSTSPKTGWLGPFARDSACYVGIDVGIDRVNVASFGLPRDPLQAAAGKTSLGWLSKAELELPIDPHAAPPPNWVDVLVECLAERLPRCVEGEKNIAVIALPNPWVHYQTVPQTEISATQSQCDSMFAGSIFQSNAHLSAWPLASGNEQWMIAATAESAACRIAQVVADVGYEVKRILPHGVALLRAAPSLTSLSPSAVIMLEMSGGLIALQNGNSCGLCRHLPASTISTTQQPCLSELEPWLQEIAAEVNATTRYATRLNSAVDSEAPVVVCGRAAQIRGLDTALATMLGRPVAVWRYAGRCRPRNLALAANDADASMAVALSLACCGTHRTQSYRRSGFYWSSSLARGRSTE